MKRMTLPAAACDFVRTAFSRSSNSPRYFAPAIERAHVERHQPLVAQAFRHVAVDDAQREAFGDGGLADAGFADQHGIVLRAARQHLDRAADFFVAADDGIELAAAGKLRQIARIFLERVIAALGRRAVGGAALTQFFDRVVEVLRVDAGIFQDLRRIRALRHGEREQEHFRGDETVARFLGDVFGLIEQTRRLGREIHLARAGAFDARQLRERRFDVCTHLFRSTAGRTNETGCQALFVVDQNLEEMFGFENLVIGPERQPLRRLNESARTLGELLNIHIGLSSLRPDPRKRAIETELVNLARPRPGTMPCQYVGRG